MTWALLGMLSGCGVQERRPPAPTGSVANPGTYSFYPGQVPGCVEAGEAQTVHSTQPLQIRQTVINRMGRFLRVAVNGVEGWIATAHPDDPRLISVLSADEPDVVCIQADVDAIDKERWLTKTTDWVSIVNLTTSRAHRLGQRKVTLEHCRVAGDQVHCQAPEGPIRLDRDGIVIKGQYKPTWSADLDP